MTSAVLWLNERMKEDVITCVQLTPYEDGEALYVQANTIIPVPGTEGYRIGIGDGSLGLQPTRVNPDTNDVRSTLQGVIDSAADGLLDVNFPEWIHRGTGWGWWHLVYLHEPWEDWRCCYRIVLRRKNAAQGLLMKEVLDMVEEEWVAAIHIQHRRDLPGSLYETVKQGIEGLQLDAHIQKFSNWTLLFGVDELTDDFAEKFADMVRQYIELVTPLIDQSYERGEFESGGEEQETED